VDFSGIRADVLEAACRRGGIIHAAAASYARGLWVRPLAPSFQGYFDSFKNWFDQYVDQVLLVEVRLDCDVYKITGKPDLVCVLIDGRFVVVDYKTPISEKPTWKAQLAAYRYLVQKYWQEKPNMLKANYPDCMSLILKGNGQPARAYPYEYADSDFAAFLSARFAYGYFK
jgi:hypothetical protein